MRARLALAASGQVLEHREVDLKHRPNELRAISPKATVPVLELRGERVIDESLQIMEWALECNDPHHWLPQGEAQTSESAQLLAVCDGDFKFHLDRYKYAYRYEGADSAEHRAKAEVFLADLDRRLGKSENLLGNALQMTDMAIAPFVRQFCFTDEDWFRSQPWANLLAWLDRFLTSALFAKVMSKHKTWVPGDDPLIMDWSE